MASSGYRNNRADGRHRNLSLFGGHRLVGRGRPGSRTAFHARAQRGTRAAGDPGGTHGRTAGTGHVQWQIVRLAAARNTVSHDGKDRAAGAAGASGFSASGAQFVADSIRVGAAGRTGKTCVGLESRGRPDFGHDSAILFRLFAGRIAGTAGSDFFAQPDGPAWIGGLGQPDSGDSGGAGHPTRGAAATFTRVADLATPRRNAASKRRGRGSTMLLRLRRSYRRKPIARRGDRWLASRNASGIIRWPWNCGTAFWGIRAKALKPTSNWRFTTSTNPGKPRAQRCSCVPHWVNSENPVARDSFPLRNIANTNRASSGGWYGWNTLKRKDVPGAPGLCWTP